MEEFKITNRFGNPTLQTGIYISGSNPEIKPLYSWPQNFGGQNKLMNETIKIHAVQFRFVIL
jgi:hypothetical protein